MVLTARARLFYILALAGAGAWVLTGILVFSTFPHAACRALVEHFEKEQIRATWVENWFEDFFTVWAFVVIWVLWSLMFGASVFTRLTGGRTFWFGHSSSIAAKVVLISSTMGEISKTLSYSLNFTRFWYYAGKPQILPNVGDRDLLNMMTNDGNNMFWIVSTVLMGWVVAALESLVLVNLLLGDDAPTRKGVKNLFADMSRPEDLVDEADTLLEDGNGVKLAQDEKPAFVRTPHPV